MHVGGVELISVAHSLCTFCFSPDISLTLSLSLRDTKPWRPSSFLGALLGAASSAPLVSSSIRHQLLPMISPSLPLSTQTACKVKPAAFTHRFCGGVRKSSPLSILRVFFCLNERLKTRGAVPLLHFSDIGQFFWSTRSYWWKIVECS